MVRLLSFNCANAVNDEKDEKYRFGKRMKNIIKLIKTQNPDVVCLQEIRTCLDEDGKKLMKPIDIIYQIASQCDLSIAGMFSLNPTKLAFARVTLYNSNTLFTLQSFHEWCSDTPHIPSGGSKEKPKIFGIGAIYTRFSTLNTDSTISGNIFWVVNVHYPLALSEKLYTNNYLINRIPQLCNQEKAIITGDMNTFSDDGYDEQVGQMKTTFREVSEKIKETFTTFPHDKFAIETGKLQTSKLDHVFSYPIDIPFVANCDVYNTIDTRESDHYMLIVDLEEYTIIHHYGETIDNKIVEKKAIIGKTFTLDEAVSLYEESNIRLFFTHFSPYAFGKCEFYSDSISIIDNTGTKKHIISQPLIGDERVMGCDGHICSLHP